MKHFNKIIILLIVLFLMLSCGEPPKDTSEKSLVSFIKENIDIINNIKNDAEKMKIYFKEMSDKLQIILFFPKDTLISITSEKAAPSADTAVYSLDNNKFMLVKAAYYTFHDKKSLFSFDNKVWYSTDNDANKNIEGVKNEFDISAKTEGNTLSVNYKMALSQGRNPVVYDFKEKREVVKLKKGMIFSSSEENKMNTDLTKLILYVPENTVFYGNVNVKGNILNSEIQNGSIRLKAMQDLYFYLKKRMMSFSFDKVNWNLNILSFSVDPVFNVYAKEDNEIYFNIIATAVYDEKKTSFSLVKLLLNAM